MLDGRTYDEFPEIIANPVAPLFSRTQLLQELAIA